MFNHPHVSDLFHCPCCAQDLPVDDFGSDEDGWCKECAQAAKDTFDYRAWVEAGG